MKSKLLIALTTAFISMGAIHSTIAKADNGGWSSQSGDGSSWNGGHNHNHGYWGYGYTHKTLIRQSYVPFYTKCDYVYYKTYNNQIISYPLYTTVYQPYGTYCRSYLN